MKKLSILEIKLVQRRSKEERDRKRIHALNRILASHAKDPSGDLDLTPYCDLPIIFPDDLKLVRGFLDISDCQNVKLPDGLTVEGDLSAHYCKQLELPDNLHVGNDLFISNFNRTPKNLVVGGAILYDDNGNPGIEIVREKLNESGAAYEILLDYNDLAEMDRYFS